MSSSDERVEALARTVAEAWWVEVSETPESDAYLEAPDFFDAVSKHLLDSPAMRDLLAETWDEGYESGMDDEAYNARGIGSHDYAVNPYRTEAGR